MCENTYFILPKKFLKSVAAKTISNVKIMKETTDNNKVIDTNIIQTEANYIDNKLLKLNVDNMKIVTNTIFHTTLRHFKNFN